MSRRGLVMRWLEAGIASVDPEERTALAVRADGPSTVVAIGKAAAAMCRGAALTTGGLRGVCVTNAPATVPDGVELLMGDHPLPGPASLQAGRRVLETARSASGGLLALVSGGGSALCEQPLPGIDPDYLRLVNSRLLDGGASIEETNLVRRHLSAIKSGGLAKEVAGPVETYVVSDVAGAGPEIVASGPTIHAPSQPVRAREIMTSYGIPVADEVWAAINAPRSSPPTKGSVEVVADGRTAAWAAVSAAGVDGVNGRMRDGWVGGDVEGAVDGFLSKAGPGLTVAAGETNVEVTGSGVGGRNSHAALLAATRIAGTSTIFAAMATDGIDGRSDGAGAIVDGSTVARGGEPTRALETSDSASYLNVTGDLINTGPTGTNVSDLWLVWKT